MKRIIEANEESIQDYIDRVIRKGKSPGRKLNLHIFNELFTAIDDGNQDARGFSKEHDKILCVINSLTDRFKISLR